MVSSAIFLAAVGVVYGMTGSLNMADLAEQLQAVPDEGLVTTVAMLFLLAFGIKAAIFPLFFWLPASYHTPPGIGRTHDDNRYFGGDCPDRIPPGVVI